MLKERTQMSLSLLMAVLLVCYLLVVLNGNTFFLAYKNVRRVELSTGIRIRHSMGFIFKGNQINFDDQI